MNRKTEKKNVRSTAASPAPLRDEELLAVTGAGAPDMIHLVVKLGPGKPFKLHEKF